MSFFGPCSPFSVLRRPRTPRQHFHWRGTSAVFLLLSFPFFPSSDLKFVSVNFSFHFGEDVRSLRACCCRWVGVCHGGLLGIVVVGCDAGNTTTRRHLDSPCFRLFVRIVVLVAYCKGKCVRMLEMEERESFFSFTSCCRSCRQHLSDVHRLVLTSVIVYVSRLLSSYCSLVPYFRTDIVTY